MDNKQLENKADKMPKQTKEDKSRAVKNEFKRQKDSEVIKAKESKLKEERAEKVRSEALKNKDLYVTTESYPGLPEGYEKVISNKLIAEKFIKKGYIKHVKK